MPAESVRVRGLRELLRATDSMDRGTKRAVRESLRAGGNIVRAEGQRRFSRINERSAAGFRTIVRQRGVTVEQGIRKTTGKRPDYGALQMRRGLLPALRSTENLVFAQVERSFNEVADILDKAP